MPYTFAHFRIRVADRERSIKFYEENLGCKLIRKGESGRGSKLAFLELPGSNIPLEIAELPFRTEPWEIPEDLFHLAFYVDNMAETYDKLTANRVKFTEGGKNDTMTFIADPDGTEIELIQRRK